MVQRKELARYCHELLKLDQFNDYSPNGLQVEGRPEITRIITGVSACQALLDRAAEKEVDAVLVHHGFFWRGEPLTVTGARAKRLKTLLQSDINLFGYHLPLDAHPTLGNNVQLMEILGLAFDHREPLKEGSRPGLTWIGDLSQPLSADNLAMRIEQKLHRKPLHIPGAKPTIQRLAWCTGGAQSFFNDAIEAGADAFITGEISEHTVHLARDSGVHFFAAGHHATERYGIKALGEHLALYFQLENEFIDIENPV